MDTGLLAALLRIPGVGKRRARSLVERFPTLEALRAAGLDEIEGVPGIGPALARRLKDFASQTLSDGKPLPEPPADLEPPPPEPETPAPPPGEQDWLKDFVEIASLIADVPPRPPEDEVSPPVGVDALVPPPPEEDRPEKAARSLLACSKCGALFAGGEDACPKCGVELVTAELGAPTGEIPEARREREETSILGRRGGDLAERYVRAGTRTRGPGRVNGLAHPAARKTGMTNGLVNGTGRAVGRSRGRSFRPGGFHVPRRSVRGITLLAGLLLVIPGLAILLYMPPPPGGIAIDGQFEDWAGVPRYDDALGDASSSLDLSDYRVLMVDRQLLVYARVSRDLWGGGNGHTQSLFAFVDEDGDSATGFQIGEVGAETAAEFYGWEGAYAGSQAWWYEDGTGPTSDDWRSLRASGSLEAASANDQVEARIVPGPTYDVERARILFHSWSTLGEGDAADALVGRPTGALAVSQRTIAAEVVDRAQEPFLAFSVRPLAAAIRLDSVTIREFGSLPPRAVTGTLFLDRSGDGVIDPTDPMLSTASFGPEGTLAVERTLSVPEFYILRADFLAPVPQASVGFRVIAAVSNESGGVPATIANANVAMSYLTAPPANVTIDGAFADWSPFPIEVDADDDVQSPSGVHQVNQNIDIRAHEAIVDTNVSVYLRVDGRLLGGVDIPSSRERPPSPSTAADADGDFVPDAVEEGLGPVLPFDFNNDNVSDADQFDDTDQDGVRDYNKCSVTDCSSYGDHVLETTIPAWYPPAYRGQVARRYIGPISLPPQRGVDRAAVYVDRDNRTDTGLLVSSGGVSHGMDYVYEAIGRGGTILEAGLYAHNASRAIPWEKVVDVPTGIDDHRLEAAFDAALVNLAANYTFVFETTDWRSNVDAGQPSGGLRSNRGGTRSADDPRTFDIPGNQKLYLRNADHPTETACNSNKVTSPTQGPGPVRSIVVRAGQSVCWYSDTTSGTTIPAGDWEALLDLFLGHGIAAYGEGSVANPRYREWDNVSFSPEASANAAVPTIRWVVVASSPLGPEKVVGVLSSTDALYVQTWDGALWSSNWNVNLGNSQTRKFDIAYEEQSGDVVVAFGDNTAQLKYRKRVAGTWDGANGDAGAPLADVPHYVRLTANPTNDDIMAAISTNADTLSAIRWNGTANSWGDQVEIPGTLASKDQEAFDVAYERASGDAFLIWGNTGNLLRYWEFTSGWGTPTTAYSLPDRALWVTAATDPEASSNRIAVGMVLNNNDFEFGAWTGTLWVTRPASVGARDKVERGIDVGFEANTNRAMFAFNPSSNPGRIAWRTWTESGGFGGVNVEFGTSGNVNFVQLRPDPRSNRMMLLYSDMNNDLFHRHWSGTSWSALATALETSLSASSLREAFMFAWTRVVEYDVYLEIWDKATDSVVETIGSCLDQQKYGDDIQCLVSGVASKTLSVNQVVRLRLVHSSLGGTFGIQFDGPGSSGNSRMTIPSIIIIPEFEVVAVPLVFALLAGGFRRRVRSRRRAGGDGFGISRGKREVAADSVPGIGGR